MGTPLDEKADEESARETRHEKAAGHVFQYVERALLAVAAAMTVIAACVEVWTVYQTRTIDLADILLMFIYTEVIGMIAVFYTGKGAFFVFPIFIAITALARLIVLQGKEMAPENLLYEAGAILLLALAALLIGRYRSE